MPVVTVPNVQASPDAVVNKEKSVRRLNELTVAVEGPTRDAVLAPEVIGLVEAYAAEIGFGKCGHVGTPIAYPLSAKTGEPVTGFEPLTKDAIKGWRATYGLMQTL
jgi:hypothetical protein